MEMMGSFRVSPTYTVAALPSAATAVRSYGTTTAGRANRPSPSAVTIAVFPAFTFAPGNGAPVTWYLTWPPTSMPSMRACPQLVTRASIAHEGMNEAFIRCAPWTKILFSTRTASNAMMKAIPDILEDPEQAGTLQERVAAARELGEADPRPGVFVRIEAGSFLRGTDAPDGEANEHPQISVHTGAYEIAA